MNYTIHIPQSTQIHFSHLNRTSSAVKFSKSYSTKFVSKFNNLKTWTQTMSYKIMYRQKFRGYDLFFRIEKIDLLWISKPRYKSSLILNAIKPYYITKVIVFIPKKGPQTKSNNSK